MAFRLTESSSIEVITIWRAIQTSRPYTYFFVLLTRKYSTIYTVVFLDFLVELMPNHTWSRDDLGCTFVSYIKNTYTYTYADIFESINTLNDTSFQSVRHIERNYYSCQIIQLLIYLESRNSRICVCNSCYFLHIPFHMANIFKNVFNRFRSFISLINVDV